MTAPMLYRRRFIPNELIPLKDDIILVLEQDLIITKWVTLHPRKDIARGISAFYLDKGYKISKIYDSKDQVVYWYCDIIQAKKDREKNTIIIEDLLVDVVLYEDGKIHIMDLNELSDALDQNLITQAETTYALRTLNSLLKTIYEGNFYTLQNPVNRIEQI
jgi:predicted RNA-binding protein associated with RNAse of E/G family